MAGMDAKLAPPVSIDDLIADFELLDDWEDRYRYVIELGRRLAPLTDAERNDANKVRGCASQVWLSTQLARAPDGIRLAFPRRQRRADRQGPGGDRHRAVRRQDTGGDRATDAEALFTRLDLRSHLTTQRANGLRALVDRIKADAHAAHAASTG